MTLESALEERNMKASELIRISGLSAPTVYNLTCPGTKPYKTGIKAETMARIADALNATIVIDATKPFYFDIFLNQERR